MPRPNNNKRDADRDGGYYRVDRKARPQRGFRPAQGTYAFEPEENRNAAGEQKEADVHWQRTRRRLPRVAIMGN